MTSPTPITGATPHSDRQRTRRQGQARCPDNPWEQEYGRDVWRLGKLGIDDRRPAHISFENIPQPWLKDLAKRWARWRLTTGLGAAAAASGTRAVARFAAFLADPVVNVDHLGQVDRAVLERYLARLHAELAGRVVHRSMIGQLNLFFTAIRQHGWDSTLPTNAMFFPEDFPKEGQRLPRALSEHVMAQLDNAGNLARWSTPDHRLVTVILMRCGLRIGDALRPASRLHGPRRRRSPLPALLQPQDEPGGACPDRRGARTRHRRAAPTSPRPLAPGHGRCCSRGPPAIPTAAIRWGTRTTAGHYAAG